MIIGPLDRSASRFTKRGKRSGVDFQPTILVHASPPFLSAGSRETTVKVVATFPSAIGRHTKLEGRLYEHDRLTPDDHLQSFTIAVPFYAATGSTTFRLSVVGDGRGARLQGNTGDYSVAEKVWQLYAETEGAGRVRGARSKTLDLPWTD